MHLKLYVDAEWIESLIQFEFIDHAYEYEDLTDEILRDYLDERSE